MASDGNESRKEAAAALSASKRVRVPETAASAPHPEVEEAEDWVISYMDMVTLLMIVFLGMVAIMMIERRFDPTNVKAPGSEPPPKVLDKIDLAALEHLGEEDEKKPEPQKPSEPPLSPEARALLERLAKAGLPKDVTFTLKDRRVAIEISDRVLFSSGQADVSSEGARVMRQIAPVLKVIDGVVSVEGHTDDVPIATPRFPSNWELSAARASAIARLLQDEGVRPSRLRAVGYADTRPIALAPAGRALNRRVTLMVEP